MKVFQDHWESPDSPFKNSDIKWYIIQFEIKPNHVIHFKSSFLLDPFVLSGKYQNAKHLMSVFLTLKKTSSLLVSVLSPIQVPQSKCFHFFLTCFSFSVYSVLRVFSVHNLVTVLDPSVSGWQLLGNKYLKILQRERKRKNITLLKIKWGKKVFGRVKVILGVFCLKCTPGSGDFQKTLLKRLF